MFVRFIYGPQHTDSVLNIFNVMLSHVCILLLELLIQSIICFSIKF